MFNFLRDFYYEEDGMGTIEIVIIIAVLVALALIFRDAIATYGKALMHKFFNSSDVETSSKMGSADVQ